MKANHVLVILIIVALISACGGAPTSVSIPPTETTVPTTPTVALTNTPEPPTFTPTPAMPSVEACKMQAYTVGTNAQVRFGIPNLSHRLPSLGTVKTIVLFADFSDVPASQTPEELLAMVSPNAEKFYSDISYGKMNYVLEPHFTWLRLSKPSSYYGQGVLTYEGQLEFLQEAVTLADPNVDFSTADSVLLMVPPEARSIRRGPNFNADPGFGYRADGKIFSNGVTSGADLTDFGFRWLNHETGHSMGLPDLYLYGTGDAAIAFKHVGDFDLMGNINGTAPEYVAFSRWQLGWLDDNQIYCQTEGEQTTVLSAIEIPGGIKAVIIPISGTKVLVIESRKKLGYDTALKKEGALVYIVNTAVYTGEGSLVVQPETGAKSTLGAGESITVESISPNGFLLASVTITVVESTPESDTVLVSVSK